MGLTGAVRGKKVRTTTPEDDAFCPTDLVRRNLTAERPNELWIADLTYVSIWLALAYVAFIIDLFARMIVGWWLSNSLKTDLPLSADNAMAESVIGLYKTEVINKQGPWKHRQAVEFATLAWVDWLQQPVLVGANRKYPACRAGTDV